MSSSKSASYPTPLVVEPLLSRKTTMIVLHGRGSTAEKFAAPLLNQPITPSLLDNSNMSPQSFQSLLPHTKFIFPTASLRRAAFYNRSLTHQWFDMYPLDQFSPEHKQHIQMSGLRESAAYVHDLLEKAVEEVGARNVVLMGMSQGCAVGIISLLLWRAQPLGAFVGMCGWCPLRQDMLHAMNQETSHGNMPEEDDMFERSEDDSVVVDTKGNLERARDWLQKELEMGDMMIVEEFQNPLKDMAVFLGHGSEDVKVPSELGDLAATFLEHLDIDVAYQRYGGLGHWYSEEMLRDIVDFFHSQEVK